MEVGLKVDFLWYPIGTGDFVHSFFSTICYRLENQQWGSRFPYLMNNLYQGKLSHVDVNQALVELMDIRRELAAFTPDKVIWDIEDLGKQPPWGNDISSDITNLSNYFVTCDGGDLFEEIFKAFHESQAGEQNILLMSL